MIQLKGLSRNFISESCISYFAGPKHYDDDVIAEIYHFYFKNDFYDETKDRKRLVRIVISALFVPKKSTFIF